VTSSPPCPHGLLNVMPVLASKSSIQHLFAPVIVSLAGLRPPLSVYIIFLYVVTSSLMLWTYFLT